MVKPLSTIRKVAALLTRRERVQVVWLMLAILLMAIVEVAGIASVMPFLALLGNPEMIHESGILAWGYQVLPVATPSDYLFFLGIVVLVAITTSNAFTAFTMWRLLRFTWRRDYTLSRRLLTKYVGQPYVFFLSRNSSELGKNILAEVRNVVSGVLIPGMELFARATVALLILGFLVVVDAVLAGTVAVVLGGSYLLIYTLVRRKLAELGKGRAEADGQRFKAASEALSGIKDLSFWGESRRSSIGIRGTLRQVVQLSQPPASPLAVG